MNDIFDFGEALKHLKAGKKVSRTAWKNPGTYLYLKEIQVYDYSPVKVVEVGPQLVINLSTETRWRWLAPCEDILAEDWFLIQE